MKIFIAIFMFTFFLYGNESLNKLGFTEIDPEQIFKTIDKYETEAPEYLKKLKDEDQKTREDALKYFLNIPSAPSEILVQALLKEKDKKARADLKKIIMSAIDKPTFQDWTQLVLSGLTEHISKNNGATKYLLEIAQRNKSSELVPKLETAMLKRSKQEDLLKIYKDSKDKIKLILFKAVCNKLSKKEIDQALQSKLQPLSFKAAKNQISKGNNKALKIILNMLTSEEKTSKECALLLSKVNTAGFDTEIQRLINELGVDSLEKREKAKLTLLALPSSASKRIEKVGLKILKDTDDPEIRVSYLNIIKSKIADLIKKPGYIGVQLTAKVENDIKMVMIQNTIENTPAAEAGIPDNCQILSMNKVNFENTDLTTFRTHLHTLSAGTKVKFSLKTSSGEVIQKELVLASKPNTSNQMIFEHWKAKNLGTQTSFR